MGADRLRPALLAVLLGPAALLLGALWFQHARGLQPCDICMWQRYGHVAVLVAGTAALALRSRALTAVAAVSLLVVAGLALYHVGVEGAWWRGPGHCAGVSLNPLASMNFTRCDQVAWSLLGISMAGWNGLTCAALGAWALWRLPR